MSTLSVDTSSSGSSTSMVSPSAFSHRVTVPSVTLSPSAGMVTLVPSPAGTVSATGAGVGRSTSVDGWLGGICEVGGVAAAGAGAGAGVGAGLGSGWDWSGLGWVESGRSVGPAVRAPR